MKVLSIEGFTYFWNQLKPKLDLKANASDVDSSISSVQSSISSEASRASSAESVLSSRIDSLAYQMGTVPANADLNTVTRVGIYTLNGNSNYTNAPINASMYGLLTVIRSGSSTSFITQIVTANGGKYFYRDTTNTGSSWTSWHELVHADTLTATSSSTLTAAISDGTVEDNSCNKRYNVVNASFRQYGIEATANGTIATLPSGYRPSTLQYINGFIRVSGSTVNIPFIFKVHTDGKINLNYSTVTTITQVGFTGTIII